jgi:AraC-like DNA-binding protein
LSVCNDALEMARPSGRVHVYAKDSVRAMKESLFSDIVVFETPLIRIGAFRCDREYPGFRDTGPARNDCFVFPRTAVQIEHEDTPPFVANPNTVTFYRRSQHYQRRPISDRGDYCDWFAVRRDAEDLPFRRHRGLCDARTYLLQRRLFDSVTSGALRNPIAIEETVLLLLERVAGEANPAPLDGTRQALVHETEHLLSARFDQPLGLLDVSSHAGASPYHLCRTFRRGTGLAIHQYLRQLRIRHGLERVCDTPAPLDRIAVDLGFAHHSHFTHAFRGDFDVTPSELRSAQSRC